MRGAHRRIPHPHQSFPNGRDPHALRDAAVLSSGRTPASGHPASAPSRKGGAHGHRGSQAALYDQLVDILTEKIEHEYRPGDLMPSERELSKHYGLSRTTVRLALQELERLGLVVRQHGRGTFVADRSVQATNLSQTYSFTDQMREMGRVPSTTILEFCEIEADKNLAESLRVHIGDKLYKLKRLRSADDMPMMVERTYLPMRKFMSLKRPML